MSAASERLERRLSKLPFAAQEDLRTVLDERLALVEAVRLALSGCWCDDSDGNCNPPHGDLCERCKRLGAAFEKANAR